MQVHARLGWIVRLGAAGCVMGAAVAFCDGYVQPKRYRTLTEGELLEQTAREAREEELAHPSVIEPRNSSAREHVRQAEARRREPITPGPRIRSPVRSKRDCARRLQIALMQLERESKRLEGLREKQRDRGGDLEEKLKSVTYYREATRKQLEKVRASGDAAFREQRFELQEFMDTVDDYLNKSSAT